MGDQQVEASSTTMEAAEQLIQLSGGGDEDESESRSADSVKGDGKEGVPAVVVESSSAGKRREIKGGGGEDDEAVMGGVRRQRPRFRSLAEIYMVTKRIDLLPCHEEMEEDVEGSSKGKKKKNRAAGGAAGDEAIVPAAPSKGRRVGRMQKK